MSVIIPIILIPAIQMLAVWLFAMKDKRQMDRARSTYEARVAHLPVRPKFVAE